MTKNSADEQSKKKELQQKKFVNKRLPEVSEELDSINRPLHKVRNIGEYMFVLLCCRAH